MTYVDDLIPLGLLDDAIKRGLVRRQVHPELPYAILNYTERAAYDGIWNPATLTCRGLIVDERDGTVVARPFPKFFNYGQPGAPELDLDAPAVVTEKMDGSLGILYSTGSEVVRHEGGVCESVGCGGTFVFEYAIATRGSFTSDQAIHATEVWKERYEGRFRPKPGLTYLFEIVYPENRIVCDYGALDDLVLLDVIFTKTGESVHPDVYGSGPSFRWPGPAAERHPYRTLGEALAAEPRPNAEGLVVAIPQPGGIPLPFLRVKIKQADYVALHRIVTGLNKRTVWEHVGAGKPIEELVAPLPDEFRPWVEDVVQELSALVSDQAREIEKEYDRIVLELDGGVFYPGGATGRLENGWTTGQHEPTWTRKEFADLAKTSKWAWALFLRLDNRDYGPKLWRNAKPDPVTPAGRVYSEDVA